MVYEITRKIGIDAAHRVMCHKSKCKNIHGHRYEIEVTVTSNLLHKEGEQTDMTLDFSFLKEEMMNIIDTFCDHGMILSVDDKNLYKFFNTNNSFDDYLEFIIKQIKENGYYSTIENKPDNFTKVYVISHSPTAERLAEHWFNRLKSRILEKSNGLANILSVKVWETPNCYAIYR